jgi:hypothetical protein
MAKGGLFMNKTKNYALNQWGPTDPIRRQDFNRDNAVLDAALAQAAERELCTTLQEVTLTEKASQYTLDLSDVDWSAWRCVVLETDILAGNGSGSASLTPNGLTSISNLAGIPGSAWANGLIAQLDLPGRSAVVFLPLKNKTRNISCVSLTSIFSVGRANGLSYASLKTLVISVENNSFLAGSTFRLLGIR